MPRRREKLPRVVSPLSGERSIRAQLGSDLTCWMAPALLLALVVVVYGPALNSPFIFDDYGAVTSNESIVSLWPLVGSDKPRPLNPPPLIPTSGRPLVNLSFAVNYAFGGLMSWGYHFVNLMLHWFSAVLAWAILRRTLRLPYFHGRYDLAADWLAVATASLWAIHPLGTEAVIYVTQRTELMMTLFYLATLYCSLRYWAATAGTINSTEDDQQGATRVSRQRRLWLTLATTACLGGMASKEVMIVAPLMVFLFDRTFVAGTLKKALRNSWPLYLALTATSVLLIALMLHNPHSDSAGFGLGVPAYEWWLTQTKVFFMYMKLVVWPWPLLIHYEFPYLTSISAAWPYVAALLVIGVSTLLLLLRNRPLGYLGTWVFAILSPTFVVPVVTEMAAERRMYLALLAPCLVFVVGSYELILTMLQRQQSARVDLDSRRPSFLLGLPMVALVFVFCLVSSSRLAAYDDELNLWLEVLQHQPNNAIAHHNIAAFMERRGDEDAALGEYREAVRLAPTSSHSHYQLAVLLNKKGDHKEAATHFADAIRYLPKPNATMQNNLAVALYMAGQNDAAIDAYHAALDIDPNYWLAHRNLGTALAKAGKFRDAIAAFETALRLNSQAIEMYNDLARAHFRLQQRQQAVEALRQGLSVAEAAGDNENAQRFTAALKLNQQ